MTNQSTLKNNYPLSPRKFKKKMVEKVIGLGILSGFIGASVWAILSGFDQNFANPKSIIAGVAAAVASFVVLMGVYGVYVHYYIKTYFYADEDDFITIRKGPITPAEIHVQYAKIQDVYVDQDLLDRLFGIYDVHISSATYSSGIEAHIDGVSKESAEGLKNLFLNKIKNGSSYQQKVSMSQEDGSITASDVPKQQPASFSREISSETIGLGSNWWTGELVKVALGSVIMPALIAFWITAGSDNGINWSLTFWIWLGALFVYVAYRLIYLALWKSHYKYNFGPEYIYMKIGVISVSEKNMGYNTIQDVGIRQTLVDRIFGVADLVIENASGATMPQVPNQKGVAPINGIVIEGMSLDEARSVSDELKKVISNKRDMSKGL